MVSITIITPEMRAHLTGCRDIKREMATLGWQRANTYTGEDALAAILAADTEMAAWFGKDVYDPSPDDTCWTVVSCDWAPCLSKALKDIKFDALGRASI